MSETHDISPLGPDGPGAGGRDTLALELARRPGKEGLDWLLARPGAAALVRRLAAQDFYWLAKGVTPDEGVPLLRLASEEQWLHLLDLEIWNRDRVEPEAVGRWLQRLIQADPVRLIDWLFGEEGELLAYTYLSRFVEVYIPDPDSPHSIPDGFESLDGVYFFRIREPELRPALEQLFRILAVKNPARYASFLGTLAGLIAGEAEEELYRLRSVRLAEKGFLPFDQALAVYAPLDPARISPQTPPPIPATAMDGELRELAPLLPLARTAGQGLLAEIASGLDDPVLRDRLRLEFAVLANQLLSAEGLPGIEYADLTAACERAADYLNLALESCGGDPAGARALLSRHHLSALFRAGLGCVMGLKREAERWRAGSWYRRRGLEDSFWGQSWEGCLAGLLRKRPLRFAVETGGGRYREFTRLAEVEETRRSLRRLALLDRLLDRLVAEAPEPPPSLRAAGATFHPLLFTGWARAIQGLPAGLAPLAPDQARAFLAAWQQAARAADAGALEGSFAARLASRLPDLTPEEAALLGETLEGLYREFADEYAAVAPADLDPRYSRFLAMVRSPEEG